MARLRLFANLREAAGTSSAEVPGSTVAQVLDAAVDRFGDDFASGLVHARIWVNGDQAESDSLVGDGDEVALIPPVSGGATVVRSPVAIEVGLVAALVAAMFLANAVDDANQPKWFTVTMVLAASMWAFDVVDYAGRRGLRIPAGPVLAGVFGGALSTFRWGVPGMAVATVGATVAALLWAVLFPKLRPVDAVAASAVLAITGTFGVSALVLLRLVSEDVTTAFLIIAVSGIGISWLTRRAGVEAVDPAWATMVAAIAGGGVAALLLVDDAWPIIIAAAAAAVALIAGRNLGSLLRSGALFPTGDVPGSLHYLDGFIMASGAFWLVLRVVA